MLSESGLPLPHCSLAYSLGTESCFDVAGCADLTACRPAVCAASAAAGPSALRLPARPAAAARTPVPAAAVCAGARACLSAKRRTLRCGWRSQHQGGVHGVRTGEWTNNRGRRMLMEQRSSRWLQRHTLYPTFWRQPNPLEARGCAAALSAVEAVVGSRPRPSHVSPFPAALLTPPLSSLTVFPHAGVRNFAVPHWTNLLHDDEGSNVHALRHEVRLKHRHRPHPHVFFSFPLSPSAYCQFCPSTRSVPSAAFASSASDLCWLPLHNARHPVGPTQRAALPRLCALHSVTGQQRGGARLSTLCDQKIFSSLFLFSAYSPLQFSNSGSLCEN